MGGECYGVVVAVGEPPDAPTTTPTTTPTTAPMSAPTTAPLAVGDRVVCVPPDGMGSHLVTPSRWVARAPPDTAPEAAVSGTMA